MTDQATPEDRAYEAALAEIERVRKAGETRLSFDAKPFRALTRIPEEVRGIEGLLLLDLDNTQVADLAPLQGLTGLQTLWLDQTAVSDLGPLQGLTGLQMLVLNQTAVTDLGPLQGLTGLQMLTLSQTAVADLGPLQGLTGLQVLSLDQTAVADLGPLQGLTGLEFLLLNQTAVADLRPIAGMVRKEEAKDGPFSGLSFQDTPATRHDPELARLSAIENNAERTNQILDYLNSLPPWPTPLPWLAPKAESDPDLPDEPPLTVTALIEAQDLAGWRFSPTHGAMELFVRNPPTEARQDLLARMAGERAAKLLASLGPRINAGGLRQEVHEEALRFQGILADTSRPLALRSLELWASLVALGALLESNDTGARDRRDPLDLLPSEARAALDTLLGVASGLVRSFPEARELDDEHATFSRRKVTRETIFALLETALRTEFVEPKSVALMQHVQGVAEGTGKQAEKSATVTVKGLINMVSVAGWATAAAFGTLALVASDVVPELSDRYELGEKAGDFLDAAGDAIRDFLEGLAPDERARLKAVLDDAHLARDAAGKGNPL